MTDIDLFDEELEKDNKCDKHGYRVIMYSKLEVEALEKQTMEKMLLLPPLIIGKLSDTFLMKSYVLFPERYPELAKKKKRGKKSNNYFIEDVGKWLWSTWKDDPTPENRNNFLKELHMLKAGNI